jgi:hypothetical protein
MTKTQKHHAQQQWQQSLTLPIIHPLSSCLTAGCHMHEANPKKHHAQQQ